MSEILKFNEWKEQIKDNQQFIFTDDTSLRVKRIKDGEFFNWSEVVRCENMEKKWAIFTFHPNLVVVEIRRIANLGEMICEFVVANDLIKL